MESHPQRYTNRKPSAAGCDWKGGATKRVSDGVKKRRRERYEVRDDVVLMAGLEPARTCIRQILSLLCIPIPPHQRIRRRPHRNALRPPDYNNMFGKPRQGCGALFAEQLRDAAAFFSVR